MTYGPILTTGFAPVELEAISITGVADVGGDAL